MYTVEVEREDDGRWIAELMEWPRFLVYGATREAAVEKMQVLTLRTFVQQLKSGGVCNSDIVFCLDIATSVLSAERIPSDRVQILALKEVINKLETGNLWGLSATVQDLLMEHFIIHEQVATN